MRFSRIFCLDGNNSLKRVATSTFGGRSAADIRVLEDARYYLPRDFVDRFSGEVRGRQPKNPPVQDRKRAVDVLDEDEAGWTDDDDTESVEGDPTDSILAVVVPAIPASDADSNCPPSTSTNALSSSTGKNAEGQASPGGSSAALPVGSSEQSAQTLHDPVKSALAKKLLEQCVKNWKAAAGEEKKQMWRMFDESGLFASACRHGFILWIVDMIRSGEL